KRPVFPIPTLLAEALAFLALEAPLRWRTLVEAGTERTSVGVRGRRRPAEVIDQDEEAVLVDRDRGDLVRAQVAAVQVLLELIARLEQAHHPAARTVPRRACSRVEGHGARIHEAR